MPKGLEFAKGYQQGTKTIELKQLYSKHNPTLMVRLYLICLINFILSRDCCCLQFKLFSITFEKNVNRRQQKHEIYPACKESNDLLYKILLCCRSYEKVWSILYINCASTRENLSSGVCKQQRCRPACLDCASAQSDQHLCYLLIGKYHI